MVVDAYEFRNEDDKADCGVGLLFFGPDDKYQETALIVVDAAKENLRLSVSDMGLVSIEMVDKLGRRF